MKIKTTNKMKVYLHPRTSWLHCLFAFCSLLLLSTDVQAQSNLANPTIYQTNQVFSMGNGDILPRTLVTHNLNAAKTTRVDELWEGNLFEIPLKGDGITIGVWDAGAVLTSHVEFGDRVNQIDIDISEPHPHATHVTGTICAKGVKDNAIGMANEAKIISFDWHNDENEMAEEAANGLLLSNLSYGYTTGWSFDYVKQIWVWHGYVGISEKEDHFFGLYSDRSRAYDLIANSNENYLIVRSAGNDRGEEGPAEGEEHLFYNPVTNAWELSTLSRNADGGSEGFDCISHGALAKNVLTVGAVEDVRFGYNNPDDVDMTTFSSWGPTDDGRIKPDICGNGATVVSTISNSANPNMIDGYGVMSGTSMATPNVTGSLALIQQYYHSKAEDYLKAASLKALILHTADEAGAAPGPDYMYGWGLMNTKAAVELVQQHFDENADNAQIIETALSNNSVLEFPIYSDGQTPIKATINWNDPAAEVNPNQLNSRKSKLINDLDLRIEKVSDGTVYQPYVLDPSAPQNSATTGDNIVDNTEQVYIEAPTPGNYIVRINHKGGLKHSFQAVSVIMSGLSTAKAVCELTAAFSIITPTCLNTTSSFLNETSNQEAMSTWLINDELVSTETHLDYIFESVGTYEVSLITSFEKCTDTLTQSVTIQDIDASFSINTETPMTIMVTPNSTVKASYVWDFGDGTKSDQATVSHVYEEAGTYTVCLTVSIDGCAKQNCQEIAISELPCPTVENIDITHTSCGQHNGQITLKISNTDPPQALNYAWNNGETGSSIENLAAGSYSVTITTPSGCMSSQNISINASRAITLNLNQENATCDSFGVLTASIENATAPISYEWSNGSTEAQIKPSQSGRYGLTVTDANGCTATASISIQQQVTNELSVKTTATSCGEENGAATLQISDPENVSLIKWSNGAKDTDNVQGLAAGDYSVSVTDLKGCVATSEFTIDKSEALVASITKSDASCNEANGSATVVYEGAIPIVSYEWSNGQTGATIEKLEAGTYKVTITDANACTAVLNTSIENSTSPELEVQITPADCGRQVGAISLTNIGDTEVASYLWNTGEKGSSIINLLAGTYTVTITDINNCTEVRNIEVPGSNALTVTVEVSHPSCGENNGEAIAVIPGDPENVSYKWDNGMEGKHIKGLAPGIYTVTVMSSEDCTASATGRLNNSTVLTFDVEKEDTQCGEKNGTAEIIPLLDYEGELKYTWSTGQSTTSISQLSPGDYSVTVSYQDCSSIEKFTIGASETLSIDLKKTDATCEEANGSVNVIPLTGAAINSYVWSNGFIGSSLQNVGAGTYKVTVTDITGCKAYGSTTIETSSKPVVGIATQNALCGTPSGSAVVTPMSDTPIETYKWSNGNTSDQLIDVAAGTYTVTITDINGCSILKEVVIDDEGAPEIKLSATSTDCDGKSGTASVNILSDHDIQNYQWSSGEQSPSISEKAPGIYEVTVTDVNGCKAVGSIEIEGSTPLEVSEKITVTSCGLNNGTIELTQVSEKEIVSYAWNNGHSTNKLENVGAGTYAVTITDADGCTFSNTYDMPTSEALRVGVIKQDALCNGPLGSIELIPMTGGKELNYQWSHGETGAYIENLDAGTYKVTITDEFGCFTKQEVDIVKPDAPQIKVSPKNATCGENNGAATVEILTDDKNLNYQWSDGSTNSSLDNLAPGQYQLEVTNQAGCKQRIRFSISSEEGPQISVSKTDAACDGTLGTASVRLLTDHEAVTYEWSNGEKGNQISKLAVGSYQVTATDKNGCTAIDEVIIEGNSPPMFELSKFDTKCNHQNGYAAVITTEDTTGWTYKWNNGEVTESISGLEAGEYYVIVTNTEGCESIQSITIETSEALRLILAPTRTSCDSITVNLAANKLIESVEWNDGIDTPSRTFTEPGTYCVNIISADGCVALECLEVQFPELKIAIQSTPAGCNGGGSASVEIIEDQPISSILWSNGETTPTITGLEAGKYSVTVTTEIGCSKTEEVEIIQVEAVAINVQLEPKNTSCGEDNGAIFLRINSDPNDIMSYEWSNGNKSRNLVDIPAGTYIVTITDQQGCKHTKTQEVQSSQQAQILALSANSSCGYANGQILLRFTNTVKIESIIWNDGVMGEYREKLTEGTYTATITDEYGCQYTEVVKIESDRPAINAAVITTPASCGENNGTAELSYDTRLNTIQWSNGVTDSTALKNLAPGNYFALITSTAGCTETVHFNIEGSPNPEVHLDPTHTTCGEKNGSLEVMVHTDESIIESYKWSHGASGKKVSDLEAGMYQVTITDINGCYTTASLVVETSDPMNVEAEIKPNQAGQNNGSISLTVDHSEKTNYQWSNGANTPTIQDLKHGDYTVTITSNSCQLVNTYTVARSKKIGDDDDIRPPKEQDDGEWNIGIGPSNSDPIDQEEEDEEEEINIENLPPLTDHIVNQVNTTPDTEGGISLGSTFDANYFLPDGIISDPSLNNDTNDEIDEEEETPSIVCPPGNAFELTVHTQATSCGLDNGIALANVPNHNQVIISYEWSNGMDGRSINNVPAGTYTLTATDLNGCTATTTLYIEASQAPQVELGSDTLRIASNESVLLDAYHSNEWQYHWSTGEDSPNILAEESGNYTVTIITPEGCEASDQITVMKTMPWEENTDLFEVYPIPASENITISTAATEGMINIYTLNGQLTANYTLQQGKQVIPIHQLSPGLYLLEQVTPQGESKRLKIIVE